MSSSHYKPDDALKGRLTKTTDGKITIKPKALSVTWGSDNRYWAIDKENEEGSITLNQVSWLEATGSFPSKELEDGITYTVKFLVQLKANAFGWQGSPVYFFVMTPDSKKRVWKKKDLNSLKKDNPEHVPTDLNFTFKKVDGSPPINFGLYEIWKGRWKGGLEILEVVVEKLTKT